MKKKITEGKNNRLGKQTSSGWPPLLSAQTKSGSPIYCLEFLSGTVCHQIFAKSKIPDGGAHPCPIPTAKSFIDLIISPQFFKEEHPFKGKGKRQSLHTCTSQVAHQAGSYPRFCYMKRLEEYFYSPGWVIKVAEHSFQELMPNSR